MRYRDCCNNILVFGKKCRLPFAVVKRETDVTLIITVLKECRDMEIVENWRDIELVSKKHRQKTGITTKENILTVDLDKEFTNEIGRVELELRFTNGIEKGISPTFYVDVVPGVFD